MGQHYTAKTKYLQIHTQPGKKKITCERINEKTFTPQKRSLSVLVLRCSLQLNKHNRALQKATYYLARSFSVPQNLSAYFVICTIYRIYKRACKVVHSCSTANTINTFFSFVIFYCVFYTYYFDEPLYGYRERSETGCF